MAISKSEVLILSRRDFRETSLIVNFYSREFGKFSGILKGIRKDPFKFGSSLEPFSYNEIVFYRKRNSSLHLITQCDLRENFTALRNDIFKTGICSLMMELLGSVAAEEDKNSQLFELTLDCLRRLSLGSDAHKIITIYKIKVLSLSGFKPHFDSCLSCQKIINDHAKFSLKLGGLLCMICSHKDKAARQIFKGTIATILYIERNALESCLNLGMNPQIKKELNLVLDAFLTFHLEKDFKAQRVLNKLNNVNEVGLEVNF